MVWKPIYVPVDQYGYKGQDSEKVLHLYTPVPKTWWSQNDLPEKYSHDTVLPKPMNRRKCIFMPTTATDQAIQVLIYPDHYEIQDVKMYIERSMIRVDLAKARDSNGIICAMSISVTEQEGITVMTSGSPTVMVGCEDFAASQNALESCGTENWR